MFGYAVKTGFILIAILLLLVSVPIYSSHAQLGEPLVPCGIDKDGDGVNGEEQCGFEHLIGLVQNVVNWLLAFAVFFAVILFSYAGFLYTTSGGSPGQVEKAHKIFMNVAVGFIIALAAWVIVNTILLGLGADDAFILLER